MFDVIIVGGGPAGLSAALMLGRCRRSVAVCDDGQPRNAASHASHGLFTRDGTSPRELLRLGRAELQPYDVTFYDARAIDVARRDNAFWVKLSSHDELVGRKLLLATGLIDRVPKLEGFAELYGKSAFHCPYCDGWEVKDQPLAIYGRGRPVIEFALGMKVWSADLVVCTDGGRRMTAEDKHRLANHLIAVRPEPIARLEGQDGILRQIVFASGEPVERRALFFTLGVVQRSELPARLGCAFTKRGTVRTGSCESTNVPGVFVAGDASHDASFLSVAVAERTKAGFAINKALRREDIR